MRKTDFESHPAVVHSNCPVCRREFLIRSFLSAAALAGTTLFPKSSSFADSKEKTSNLVLGNFGLFDNKSRNLIKDQIIVIKNGRIHGVESRGDQGQYQGYRWVDLGGRTVLPGLIDNHVHITVPFVTRINLGVLMDMNSQIELNFKNCILNGVTTVRDVGGFPGKINQFRNKVEKGEIPGPRVISSLSPIAARNGEVLGAPEQAPYFTNPLIKWLIGGNYAERPTNTREIEKACQNMLAQGAQWLKTLYQERTHSRHPRKLPVHSDKGYRKILEIGRRNGIKSAFHQPFVNGFLKGVEFGYHTLEHTPQDGIIPDDAIERFIRQDMAILPTLMVYHDFLILEELRLLVQKRGTEYLLSSPTEQVMEEIDKYITLSKTRLTESEILKLGTDPVYVNQAIPNADANIAKLYRMGATIGIGTDIGGSFATFFGRYSAELKLLSDIGIPNFDILCMATSTNARIIGLHDEIGTIEKGKLADVIAVRGNPLDNLDAMDQIDFVLKEGQIVKSEGIAVS